MRTLSLLALATLTLAACGETDAVTAPVATSLEAVASSPVDDALATMGRSRRIALTAPGFGSILAILPQSNLVAALPLRLAANTLPKSLALFELPFSVAEIAYQLIWHRRWAEDAGHKWLRSLAEQTAR